MVINFLFHKNLKGIRNHVNDHTINYTMEENIDRSNGWGSWQPCNDGDSYIYYRMYNYYCTFNMYRMGSFTSHKHKVNTL